ncbi:MAG: hypothetical protein Q9159_003382 [Coniocarpon cinnabarinum]
MDGRPIPGFYYDTVKKKYFQIQPDHLATPGSSHTRSFVRYEEEQSKRQRVEAQEFQRIARERVRPASIRTARNAYSVAFQAETGTLGRTSKREAMTKALVTGLRHETRAIQDPLFPAWPQRKGYWDDPFIDALCYDDTTSSAIVSRPTELQRDQYTLYAQQKFNQPCADHCSVIDAWGSSSCCSSLSLTPSRFLFVTSYGEGPSSQIRLLPLLPLGVPPPVQQSFGRYEPRVRPVADWNTIIAFGMQDTCVFNSASNDYLSPAGSSTATFLVAMSKKASVCTPTASSFNDWTYLHLRSDALCCDWQDAHVAALGTRRGDLVLWDTRVRDVDATAMAASPFSLTERRKCGTKKPRKSERKEESIMNLHCLRGGNQLVVRGGRGTAGLFDLRVLGNTMWRASQPTIGYELKRDEEEFVSTGFAVSEELEAVAIADNRGSVGIFGLKSGQRMGTIACPMEENTTPGPREPVSCLKWIERDGKDVLLGARGPDLAEWLW